jgi:cytochrome c oxidase subunit 3
VTSTAATTPPGFDSSRVHSLTRPNVVSVGTIVWLASELMFFAGLFATYFTLRGSNHPWPPAGTHLAVVRTGFATLALIASSGTIHLAVRSAEEEDRRSTIRWLAATIGLGLLFLANQLTEWLQLDFSVSTSAYGSMFYLMTGFHGLHVIGGLCFMLAVIVLVSGRTSRVPPGTTLQVCSYYGHFVDVVCIGMYTTLYLLR